MPNKKRKTYQGTLIFKADADETGQFTATFATFNVIDHDWDVTTPGAFKEGQEVLIEGWNHDWGPPVGKGIIHQDDEKAWVEGQFFLDTKNGIEHYRVVKAVGEIQEWSYTFEIENGRFGQFEGEDVYFLEALDVWGVAPVTRGAGIGTETTSIKREKDSGEGTPEPDEEPSQKSGEDEGEAGDGKPSGVDLILTQIEIMELEAGIEPAED